MFGLIADTHSRLVKNYQFKTDKIITIKMSIDSIIALAVSNAVKNLYGVETPAENIVPQATRKEFEGNITVVVFPWVKAARKSPEAVGMEIGE